MQLKELKTEKDVFNYLGLDENKAIPTFEGFPEIDRGAMIAHAKLILVVKAINMVENGGKEWFPNWDDGSYKYCPWFYMDSPGFRCDNYAYWLTGTDVGSRLCFKTENGLEHAKDNFKHLYESYFVKKEIEIPKVHVIDGIEYSEQTLRSIIKKANSI